MHPRYLAALGALAAACLASSPASAESPFAAKLSQTDKTFLVDIAQSNLGEVAAANLALQRSDDPLVKSFAQKMIDEHADAQQNVETYAKGVDFTLPVTPAPADAAVAAHLQTLHGHTFDVAYLTAQEAGHRRAVGVTRDEIVHGTQADVAGLARLLLPTIEQHLELAKRDLASLNDPTQSGELNGRR